MKLHDTIAAIATPIGSGGIAILRISGKDAEAIAGRVLSASQELSCWESHKLILCHAHRADDPEGCLDQVLAVVMRAPRSYTGEDVVEIHCHGGFLVADRILKELLGAGARLAEGGEFTRRAFLNGKTGLDEAEAVMDVIDARSQLGLENAARSLQGGLKEKIDELREQVMAITAHISAAADYPEEVDAPTRQETAKRLEELKQGIENLLGTFETGRMLREGIQTVIAGRPNVGKSSLLNAMARCEKAIVTDIPGTTRDVIEETVNVGGVALRLLDTAGLRQSEDAVEQIGIDRAREKLATADLCLFVIDSSRELSQEDEEIAGELPDCAKLVLLNKTDCGQKIDRKELAKRLDIPEDIVLETAVPKSGEATGITELEEAISRLFLEKKLQPGQVYLSNVRQRDALQKALDALLRAEAGNDEEMPYDLLFVDLEDVLSALGEVTGQTVQEEIIDQVFSRFCVGK